MNVVPFSPEINKNLSTEQRVDLILDLTRRLDLLEDLLQSAREKWHVAENGELSRLRSC